MLFRITFLAAIAVGAAPAAAQQAASPAAAPSAAASAAEPVAAGTPSVAGYLCTFAGKCDGGAAAAPVETIDAPRTKGFRLARAAAPAAPSAASPPVASAMPARARLHHGYVRAASAAPVGRGVGYARVPALAAIAGGRPRADLLIGFELNSARLTDAGLASARVFAQSLATPELAGKHFVIEGHTDLRGGRALNLDLSRRRAEAVADYLAAQGVDRSRLTTRGVGPDVPLPGHAATDPGNRRVEAELAS